jgi:hypothetical protein
MDTALFLYIAIHNDFCKYLTDRDLQRNPWMPFATGTIPSPRMPILSNLYGSV